MDELLDARVKQLKEIDERLERIAADAEKNHGVIPERLRQLRFDLRTWIDRAELEYAEF